MDNKEGLNDRTEEKISDEIKFLQIRITELEKVESRHRLSDELLRKTELQQKAILNNIPDIAWLKDKESKFIAVNEAFGRACGFEPKELEGKSDLDIWPLELAQKYRADDKDVMESGRRKCVEEQLADKEGKVQWVETIKTPIYNDKGEVIGTTGIARDITERKRYEERLHDAYAELGIRVKVRTAELTKAIEELRKEVDERKRLVEAFNKNKTFLANVFSSIQDGISVLDKELSILLVNPVMEKWYADRIPFIGKKCHEVYQCSALPCKNCPVLVSLKTQQLAVEIVPRRASDGEIIGWFELYSFPMFDQENKELIGVIEYVRDITGRKATEERVGILNGELLKSNKRLKQLLLTDSHTGLYNHRYLEQVIEAEFHRAKRYAHPLSVIMLDIDYFKSINDLYGHQFGDLVLKQFARRLKLILRKYDIIIRSGGEEFIIISPGIDITQGLGVAQRILEAINLYNFGDKNHNVKLKLSLAVASYPEDRGAKGMSLVNLADQILAKAKEFGGNRVYSVLDIRKQKDLIQGKRNKTTDIKLLQGKLDKLTKSSNQSLVEAIFAFAKAIELKDHYTGEHVGQTVRYVTGICNALGLPKEEIELIKQGAALHDLGKIGISEKILLKKSKLTAREFREIKKHPQIGADILRPIQFLRNIIPLVFYHHEKWDGSGYPGGIKGEEIPIGARIIAIADVYQALISDRPYRKAYKKEKAMKILKKGAGSQFDPRIVDVFLKILQAEK